MRLASATPWHRLLDVWQSHGQQVANSRMHRCGSNMFKVRGLMSAWFATASTSKGSCLIFSLAPRWNSRRSSCAPSALCHKLVCVFCGKSPLGPLLPTVPKFSKRSQKCWKVFRQNKALYSLIVRRHTCHGRSWQWHASASCSLYISQAQTTDYLQPLDLQGFSPFKQYLKRKHQELRSYSEHGLVPPLAWLWQCMQAPHEFWPAWPWQKSFDAVGCNGPGQVHKALQHLMGAGVPWPGPDRPTPQQMQCVWPARRQMAHAYKALFLWCCRSGWIQQICRRGWHYRTKIFFP